jgi:hypothetical protein
MSARRRAAVVRRYLRTGQHDHQALHWEGLSLQPRLIAKEDLQVALLGAVRQRAAAVSIPSLSLPEDVYGFARAKVEPMVRGLFPAGEQEPVLDLLARSVVFVTPETVEDLLRRQRWPHTAWALANLYLDSIGAELLGPRAPHILGVGEETTSYVSLRYFSDPEFLADYVLHEAAHLFHNCKRRTAGLPETRGCEWLLPIEFRMRETFALACEFYASITAAAATRAGRRELLARLEQERPRNDAGDGGAYLDILGYAIEGRNGWKRILDRCRDRSRERAAAMR